MFLQPARCNADPDSSEAEDYRVHLYGNLNAFLDAIKALTGHKLNIVISLLHANVYEYVKEKKRKYMTFETCDNLYQFCRIQFGVTDAVA